MLWTERRVFVTGATGVVGSWLVKRLLDAGAFVVVLVRDADPQSELLRSGDLLRTTVVNGRLEDYATPERAINEHEIDTVFHLGAQPIVTTAHRNPLPTFEANIRGSYNMLGACCGAPRAGHLHRGRQQRRRPTATPRCCLTPKTCPPTAGIPTTSARALRDLLAAVLRRDVRSCRSRSRDAATSTAAAT